MTDVQTKLKKQFIGQARLIRLLLWRIGDSTDIDTCMNAAQDMKMLNVDDIDFLMNCLSAEEEDRNGQEIDISIEEDLIVRLRRCADKLNRADSA